jgi:hypothetical protein
VSRLTTYSLLRKWVVAGGVLVLIDDRDRVEAGSRLP